MRERKLEMRFLWLTFFLLLSSSLKGEVKEIFNLTLPDISGKEVKLSQFQGKIILINFWSLYCYYCRKEIPELVKLQEKYQKDNLQVMGIHLGPGGERLKFFIQKQRINYPVLMGNKDVVKKFGGIRGVPTSFLIDEGGRMVKTYVGYHPMKKMEEDIRWLLKRKKPKS